jgi:hypothetical protein
MNLIDTLLIDTNLAINFIEHHIGLSFIVLAFISLFYQKFVNGKKV